MRKGIKQRPHIRTSRRGRKFRAGRGLPKIRASKLRKDIVRKGLVFEGTPKEREKVVRIFENRDPLAWKEYTNLASPKIKVIPDLIKDKGVGGYFDSDENEIGIDQSLFTELRYVPQGKKAEAYEPEKILDSGITYTPTKIIRHELQHAKYPQFRNAVAEDMATWRALFDIKKFKKPISQEEKDIADAFNGPILKEDVSDKK